jgi:hypothetical protein
MLARRLGPPEDGGPPDVRWADRGRAADRAEGRWRTAGRRPTRGPLGAVEWWTRPAPGRDDLLWEAVCRIQERRIARGLSVSALARRTAASGRPIRRETLSRVLNGAQPTSWDTAEALADVLDVDLSDLHGQRFGSEEAPEPGDAEVHHLPGLPADQ